MLSDGSYASSTGNYNDTIVGGAANGCDSLNIIDLTVLPLNATASNDTLCFGDSLMLSDGSFVNTSGTYNDTMIGTNACDSIHTFNVYISPLISTNRTEVLCFGDSLMLSDGSYVHTSGIYNDTTTAANGCDSVDVIDLTISPLVTSNRTETLCFGDSLQLSDGSFVNTSGIYNDTLVAASANGCDSIDIIDLNILPLATATRSVTLCFGDSLMLSDGSYVNTSSIYNDTIPAGASSGCDSIDVINLLVLPFNTSSSNDTLCYGDSLMLSDGSYVSMDGTYNDTLTAANGCDSVHVYNLTVSPLITAFSATTLCFGDSLMLSDGSYASSTGNYNDTIVGGAANGCDSLNIIDLTVLPLNATASNDTLCFGDSLMLSDGSFVNTSGTYNDTMIGTNACDSIHTFNVYISPLISTNRTEVLCFGDSLMLSDGSYVHTSGIYNDTTTAANGCDSVDVIDLTISPLVTSNRTETLCFGDSLQLSDGSFVNTSGIYNDTLVAASANGCDSIDIIDLNILPLATATRSVTLCFGDSLMLSDGSYVNTSSIYNDTIPAGASSGCDSIDVINLLVLPLSTDTIITTICSNDSLVLSNGTVVNTTGMYEDTLTAANGCDSVLVYDLSVNPVSNFVDMQTICNGQQYVLPGGGIASVSGVYMDTLVGANTFGCDSIIETNLTVLPNPDTLIVDSFCSGGSYTLASGTIVTLEGMYNDTLFGGAANGCDSLLVYDLNFSPLPAAVQVFDTICFNETYVLPDGIVVNTTGIYLDTIPASNSCDSIVETNLFVRPANTIAAQSQSLILCPGENATYYVTSSQSDVSYQWFNGGVAMVGETNDTLLLPSVAIANSGTNYQVEIYSPCDTLSSNIMSLTVRQFASVVNDPVDEQVCEGSTASFSITADMPVQSFEWYVNGLAIPASNSANYTTAATSLADDGNQYFCVITDSCGNLDSSAIAILNVNPNLTIDAASSATSACAGDNLTLFVQATGANITYQWLENGFAMPGETNDTLVLTNLTSAENGNIYTCQVNSDCGDLFSNDMALTVREVSQIISQTDDIKQCGGFSFDVEVEANDVLSYQWQINQGGGFVNLSDGTLGAGPIEISGANTAVLTVSNYDLSITGTQFQVILNTYCGTAPIFTPVTVTISEPVQISNRVEDTVMCLLEISPIYLPYVDGAAEWSNGDLGQYLVPEFTGEYIVSFTDTNLCPQEDTVYVELEDCVANCVVVAPTGFSPNGNGTNDVFRAIYTCELDFYELMIMNRWGEMIFTSDDPLIGWDGSYKGKTAEIGTYTWYILYKKVGADRKEEIKGNVTLIR